MMSSTLGAPLGGTTWGGHHGFESLAFSLITPPNFSDGGGSCLPSMVVVAAGEPGVPVVWISALGDGLAVTSQDTTIPQIQMNVCLVFMISGIIRSLVLCRKYDQVR